jgi:hypothetical protein
MNRYSIAIPRAAFGLVAVAMTALTLAVGVVMPATLGSLAGDARVLAATEPAAARAETGPSRLRIDVVGVREQATAYVPVRHALPANKQQS